MSDFNAGLAIHHVAERSAQVASGERTVPVGTAIVAVLAAVATLFANHSSIRSLAYKNEAVLYRSQASDRYNSYESSIVRSQVDQGLLDSELASTAGDAKLRARLSGAGATTHSILEKARELDARSESRFVESERVMASYESFEVAAVIFEIAVVLASITALTRGRIMLLVSLAATLTGLGFLIAGFLQ